MERSSLPVVTVLGLLAVTWPAAWEEATSRMKSSGRIQSLETVHEQESLVDLCDPLDPTVSRGRL